VRRFRFLPEAREELLEEIQYYGSLQEGLGVRFESAVASVVRRASANPEHGAPRSRSTRRMLVKGFPFSVIYRVSATEVLIVAVADSRRRPDYWAGRIR
jgi:plasmid stabilization system protein ParE